MGNNVNEVQENLQLNVNNVMSWCENNQLTSNTKKIKVMVFGSRHNIKKTQNISISIWRRNSANGSYIQIFRYTFR